MEKRRTINEIIDFQIKAASQFKQSITFGEICSIKDVLPTDIVRKIRFKEVDAINFSMSDVEDVVYQPILSIIRERPETDDEYLERKQKEEKVSRDKEEIERTEYLRLKAKFDFK